MVRVYKESESIFSFEFRGENSIDAEALVVTINNVLEAFQTITVSQDPEAFVKLKITKFRNGSFDIDFKAIVSFVPTLITPENVALASNVISIFINSIAVKNFLRGKKPKRIEMRDNRSIVTNSKGEEFSVDKRVVQTYFKDSKLDRNIINIFNVIMAEEGCKGLTIKQDRKSGISIAKTEFVNMTRQIVEDNEDTETMTSIIEVPLLLKKPDLLGNSRWGFVLDKNIEAAIKDEEWLKKVHSGEVKLYAGVKIPVRLLIECILNKKTKEPIDARYTVLKVTGDIIEPKDGQQRLF